MTRAVCQLAALATALSLALGGAGASFGEERHVMPSRVPADKLAEARALKSPLPDSPELVEKGKALYNGKGGCVNCHGKEGRGDGPVARELSPSPRNFHHRGFWRHRTDGEIFWVIKHGSSGTSMIGFGSQLTDEEIWTVMRYLRTFAGAHGPRGGMGRRGPGGSKGECCEKQEQTP
jgi:mono/diheme cytochrome c family protein